MKETAKKRRDIFTDILNRERVLLKQRIKCCRWHRLLLLLYWLWVPGLLVGQDTLWVTGIVTDETTRKPVPFANVSVEYTANGTTADEMGRFELRLPAGRFPAIIVSHINYFRQKIMLTDSLINGCMAISLNPKPIQLPDVVISAGLYEQPLELLTRSAGIIPHREIVDHMNSNMTDVLASTPGFTQIWEYHSPIILRGLNSNRLIILKDGNRRIGTFSGGYFGQDMNIYDIRNIEIIKGPGSVIYGSGAISGVVNVISPDPFGGKRNSVQFQSGYGSNNDEFLEVLKVCHRNNRFGISINGKYRKTGDMVYGNGEKAENSDVDDRDVALNTGYRFSDQHKVILNASYHYGDWGKPRGFNGPTKDFTKVRNKEENYHLDVSYAYSPEQTIGSVHVHLYYDNGWRDYYQYKYSTVSGSLSALDLVHYKDQYGGGRAYVKLNLSKSNILNAGIDGYLFRLNDPAEVFDYYNGTEGKIEGSQNAGQQDAGLFIQDEWTIGKQLHLSGGLRFDAAFVTEGENPNQVIKRVEQRQAFSGNFGLVYTPRENHQISINLGRAFRMPTTEEMFTCTITCQGTKIGNPDLHPEYSWNLDLGFRGDLLNRKGNYELALFYNLLDGFITMAPSELPDADFTFMNTNARIMGGELSGSWRFDRIFAPSNVLILEVGAAYVYGIDRSLADNPPLFGIPPLDISLEAEYRGVVNKKWITGYFITTEADYAAAQNCIPPIPTGTDGGPWGYVPSDPHLIFNLSMGLNSNALPGSPKIRLIINNLLNSNYMPYGSYIPAMGRNIKVLIGFHF